MQDEFLTTRELAERWKIKENTLAILRVNSNGCPYVKIGRTVRYRLSDVVAYESRGDK